MFTKITDQDLENKGVIGQPNVPQLTTLDMQKSVEQVVREVAIPGINRLVEELAANSAAGNIGARLDGSEDTLQAVLDALLAVSREHQQQKDNPHSVTAEQTGAYTKDQTNDAIEAKMEAIGAGDMRRAVYDADGDGVVDVAAKLLAVLPGQAGGTGGESAAAARSNLGLGQVDNTADAEKRVLEAKQLGITALTSLDAVGRTGIFYYNATATGNPNPNVDGLVLAAYYGVFGAMIAFPTSGGIWFRSGTDRFSEWASLLG